VGTTTDGEINFGIVFEEGFEFPWSEEDGIDAWWREVNGYARPFELYDDKGGYLNGVKPDEDKLHEYYRHGNEWDAANPLPVAEVNYCSGNCPMYMLAVPGSNLTSNRGYPKAFDPAELKVAPEQVQSLLDFCERYGIKGEDMEPRWYLTSYWG
jgi:hypothetical protein